MSAATLARRGSASATLGQLRRLPLLPIPLELVPRRLVQHLLPEPDGLRRHLDELVLRDPLERLLERHVPRRREDDVLVAAGGADVGELLLLADVVREVVLVAVLAPDHPRVHPVPRLHEQRPALLPVEAG